MSIFDFIGVCAGAYFLGLCIGAVILIAACIIGGSPSA